MWFALLPALYLTRSFELFLQLLPRSLVAFEALRFRKQFENLALQILKVARQGIEAQAYLVRNSVDAIPEFL